jgi:transposase
VNQYRKDHAGDEPPLSPHERIQLAEAQRELRELRMENEFLKKAAAYFARDPR